MAEQNEALAGLRILVAVAQADGKLLDEEKRALEHALEGVPLPEGLTLDALLKEDVDVEAQIPLVQSPAAREETYRAAMSVAWVDGSCSPEERALLERVKYAFGIDEKSSSILKEIVAETKDTVLPSHVRRVDDPAKRAAEIQEDTLKYAIMSAVLGAFPVPGLAIATDIAVVALQTKLVRDIGLYYGHTLDKKSAGSLLGGVVGGAGMRIAVSNIVKLVPVWGAVVGATTSFATTYAIGKVAQKYFDGGAKVTPDQLRDAFASAKKEGTAAYGDAKAAIDAKASSSKEELARLADDLKAQKITQAEYDRRVAELI